MSEEQTKWAYSHDWFISSVLRHDGTRLVVVRHELDADKTREFTNFKLLCEWAGY